MIDRAVFIFAFMVLVGFVGILVIEVPRLDLGMITAATLLLVGCDLVGTLRKKND